MRRRMAAALRRAHHLACRSVVLLACAVPLPALAQQPAAAPEPAPPFITGAATHFAQGEPDAEASLRLAAQAGIRSIRDNVYWNAIERQRGQFVMPPAWDNYVDAAARAGIDPVLVLAYGNPLYDGGNKPRSPEAIAAFTRYAEFVARHFQGKVHQYEVWNEWDNAGGGGTPGTADEYAALLKSVYPALKAIDPGIRVLADAMITGHARESDMQKLDQLGLLPLLDGIAIHPYRSTPEVAIAELRDLEAALRRHNGGKTVPIYVTETGWSTFSGGVSLTRAAAFAARLLLLARTTPFIAGVWWYDFRNDGESPNGGYPNFGLVWQDLTPKPAFDAIGNVTAALAGASFVERVSTADDDDWVLRFRTAQGQDLWALWTTKEGVVGRFGLASVSASAAPVELHEAGRRPVMRPWVADPQGHGISRLDVTAGETPILLRGDLTGIIVDHVLHPPFPADRR